jgi:hypothetical protein
MPGIFVTGQIREGTHQLEEAPHSRNITNVITAKLCQPAAYSQSLKRKLGFHQMVTLLVKPGCQNFLSTFSPGIIAYVSRRHNHRHCSFLPPEDNSHLGCGHSYNDDRTYAREICRGIEREEIELIPVEFFVYKIQFVPN